MPLHNSNDEMNNEEISHKAAMNDLSFTDFRADNY